MKIQQAILSGAKIKRAQCDTVWHVNDSYLDGVGMNEGDCLTVEDLLAEDWVIASREISATAVGNAMRALDPSVADHTVSNLCKALGLE